MSNITVRISQISMPVDHTVSQLFSRAKKLSGIRDSMISDIRVNRRSLDARKKDDLRYIYSVDITLKEGLKPPRSGRNISIANDTHYVPPERIHKDTLHVSGQRSAVAVVGDGPAGLFCAYILALAGISSVIFERGKCVDERQRDVDKFWRTGILDENSNVQFGEGGAGTFSDGKLNTLVNDRSGRNRFVLETFVKFGAPEKILYDARPHMGTDILCGIIKNMREDIVSMGGEFCFSCTVTDFISEGSALKALKINDKDTFKTDIAVLATGHSARDTFKKLRSIGLPIEAKPFSVGLRAEHPQQMINESQYGTGPDAKKLPAAAYKLSYHTGSGRGVYSFCMCPGGYVVNASSQKGRLAVNGMSYSGRSGKNANSAICISVNPSDFKLSDDPLAGMYFQQELEEKAFEIGAGKIPQQLFCDFENGILSRSYGGFSSMTKGETAFADLGGLFSPDMSQAFTEGMHAFGRRINGFDREDCILSGIESRTSSPVRIIRNDLSMSPGMTGLYPCGEGAGYAGGIMSAAIDGIKTAEAIIKRLREY